MSNDPALQDIRMLRAELDACIEKVLKDKHASIWGRPFELTSEAGMAAAIKFCRDSIVFPVLVELGLVDSVTNSEQQGNLFSD